MQNPRLSAAPANGVDAANFMGRVEAERLLQRSAVHGGFVIRTSQTKANTLVLSVLGSGRVQHFPIQVSRE